MHTAHHPEVTGCQDKNVYNSVIVENTWYISSLIIQCHTEKEIVKCERITTLHKIKLLKLV